MPDRGTPWTARQKAMLAAMWRDGHSAADIAAELGRTPKAVQTMAHALSERRGAGKDGRRTNGVVDNLGRPRWTKEKEARLRELWLSETAVRLMAKEFGLSTKAIYGKVERMRLPRRQQPTGRFGKKGHLRQRPGPIGPPAPAPRSMARLAKQLELTPFTCRWPTGDKPDWSDYDICMAPCEPTLPYCENHMAMAVTRG